MPLNPERLPIQSIVFRYFFLSLVVVFSLFSIFYYMSTAQYLRKVEAQRRHHLLTEISVKVEEQFQEHLIPLENLVKLAEFKDHNFAGAAITTRRFFALNNGFDSFHLYNPNGDLRFAERSAQMPKYAIDQNVFTHPTPQATLIAQALKEKRPQISSFFQSFNGTVFQLYVVPILNESETEVIAIASAAVVPRYNLFIKNLQRVISSSRYGVYITNKKGDVISQTAGGAKSFLMASEPSSTQTQELKKVGLKVHLVTTQTAFEAQIRQLYFRIAIAYIVCLILGLTISILLSRRLSVPVKQALQTLIEFNRGNFCARAHTRPSNDELELLCTEANALGEKIEKDKYLATLWSAHRDDEL